MKALLDFFGSSLAPAEAWLLLVAGTVVIVSAVVLLNVPAVEQWLKDKLDPENYDKFVYLPEENKSGKQSGSKK